MPHHWSKLRVEEMLFESGLSFTVLQPAAYMQNLLAGWKLIAEEGVLRNPYPVQTRLSLVDLEDVAQAAALVLPQTEVAAILSEALGRPVRAEAEPIEAWEPRARAAGLSDHQRATLIKMFHYYERHGLMGNPNTLR